MAAKSAMMNLQLLVSAAVLTPPTITIQYFNAQFAVGGLVQPDSTLFLEAFPHDACFTDSRNDSCCCGGRNRKNRVIDISSTSGFPLSRLAPARKSAQIISRQ